MNQSLGNPKTGPENFDFLLFRSGPFLLGVLAEQVDGINRRALPQAEENIEIISLREIFPVAGDEPQTSQAVFLKVKGVSHACYVRADTAEGVITLQRRRIKRLPPLIDLLKQQHALWGLAPLKEEIAFFLDLDRIDLKRDKRDE